MGIAKKYSLGISIKKQINNTQSYLHSASSSWRIIIYEVLTVHFVKVSTPDINGSMQILMLMSWMDSSDAHSFRSAEIANYIWDWIKELRNINVKL